jgi:hypothetical protein
LSLLSFEDLGLRFEGEDNHPFFQNKQTEKPRSTKPALGKGKVLISMFFFNELSN